MSSAKKLTGYELAERLRKTRRRHPLTATEQALYYELVAICNEVDWDDVFTCSNQELCHVLCVSDNTLNTARMALINAGLIYYSSGKSRRQYSSYSFTTKLMGARNSKTATAKNEGVAKGTNSINEVATVMDAEIDNGVDAATNAADYIQRESRTEPKSTYASIEASDDEAQINSGGSGERKKSSSQKKKEDEVTPHWNAMRQLWIDFYQARHNGIEPTFNAQAGQAMKSILKRLAEHSKCSGECNWSVNQALTTFNHFLQLAYSDEWLSRHFRLPTLASHYDSIIQKESYEQASSKARRVVNPKDINSSLKRSVYDKLQGLASEG